MNDNTNAQSDDTNPPADTAAPPPVAVSHTDDPVPEEQHAVDIANANAALAEAAATGLPTEAPPIPIAPIFPYQPNVAVAVAELNYIVGEATFWGGELGVRLRNAALRARTALTGKAE